MRENFFKALRTIGILALGAIATPEYAAPADFEGVWVGEIQAPQSNAALALAFTTTPEKGQVVSLSMPEMFLHGLNFGPAHIDGEAFELPALNLSLTRQGDQLIGTFVIAKLPVRLHRGGAFPEPLPTPNYPAAPAALWTKDLGAPAWGSPVVREGTVYLGTTDGTFHAVRAADGVEIWKWKGEHACFGGALVGDEDVYFLDSHDDLIALARSSGTLKWRTPLRVASTSADEKDETFNHRAATPVTDGKGTLYVGATDGSVHSVRARSGKILWTVDVKAKIHASVALVNDRLFVPGFDGTLRAIDVRTQREVFRTKLPGALSSAPVITGNRIVIGARDYMLYGLDAKTGSVVWKDSYWFSWVESAATVADGRCYIGGSDYRRVSAIDPRDGKIDWAADVRGLSWGSPVVTEKTVFAGSSGQNIEGTVIKHTGGITAIDRGTGAVKWRYESQVKEGAAFSGFAGSLVLADGRVVGATVDGSLIALPTE